MQSIKRGLVTTLLHLLVNSKILSLSEKYYASVEQQEYMGKLSKIAMFRILEFPKQVQA